VTEGYDVLVVGGGPGGYATALRAVRRGLRVGIVEADKVGGTCLHRGCIPSKALLHVGHLADQMAHAVELGLAEAGPGLDTIAAGRFRDRIVGQMHKGLVGLLRAEHVDVHEGWGELVAPSQVRVGDAVLSATNVVIATGSRPIELPGIEFDGERILRSDEALQLLRLPTTAVIVGAGAIGVEFASLWRSFGSDVTLVEAAPRILPLEDTDSSVAVARAFRARGIGLRTSTSITRAVVAHDGVSVALADGTSHLCDQLLVAVGRRPSTSGFGLESLGVLDGRGYVQVDPFGRTEIPGLWAVGDAIATLSLAHAAFAEGFVVADSIAGVSTAPVERSSIPRVTYSSPEVASVGLTEREALEVHGHANVRVTTTSFGGNARAAIDGTSGHVKLVTLTDGPVIGAHVVGPSATELIAELGLAVSWEAFADELAAVVHGHPTLSENVREAALAAAGVPFHVH
jgi:dihydrolipoamide dehydrogenase